MKSMKLGSSAGRAKPTTPTAESSHAHADGTTVTEGDKPRGKPPSESKQKSLIPRTRDDSSDEEDHMTSRPQGPLLETMPSLMGHAPILPHPFPGSYPPPPHPHHMMPMRGGPEQFYGPHGGRGIVGPAPLPPHSAGSSGGGILTHHMPPPPMVSGSNFVWEQE